ncbi:TatD family hydrolase [Bacillus sp. 1P06AnD]|uniref:TatD family hydrolase n=1 Tax=Bacillus sp. 1P06AnD TaxID=3132208 RepID=UPI0039A350CF
MKLIDSHIHIDTYKDEQRERLLSVPDVAYFIAVSMDLASSKTNLQLSKQDARIKPAFGFHPEQDIPDPDEIEALFEWMENHVDSMVAVGEVGLPYYKRQEEMDLDMAPYIDLLERFIVFAKKHDKPIILHAVYEDGETACMLLEKHGMEKAHFHWFKGEDILLRRMNENGYMVSVTPDICYEQEIQHIVDLYPLEKLMLETDGPWPFEERFKNQLTSPEMMYESIVEIAGIKGLPLEKVWEKTFGNTIRFYELYNG